MGAGNIWTFWKVKGQIRLQRKQLREKVLNSKINYQSQRADSVKDSDEAVATEWDIDKRERNLRSLHSTGNVFRNRANKREEQVPVLISTEEFS